MYKKLLIGLLMFMLFDGCAPANKITYTWTNPSFKTSKPYKKIFLAALVNNPHVRTHQAQDLALLL